MYSMRTPTVRVEFTPYQLELVRQSLAESVADCEMYEEPTADEFRRLLRVFEKACKDIIPH